MTLAELLKKLGLADDVIAKIVDGMKENKIYTAAEENLDTRYTKLKGDHEAVNTQLTEANALIETLKKSTKGNETLQTKIGEYETTVASLEEENRKLKIESALKVKLLESKADDIDYLMYKIDKKEDLKLGEDGSISGIDGIVSELQTKFPGHFGDGTKAASKVVEKKFQQDEKKQEQTKSITQMTYAERLQLHRENPEAYNELVNKK